MFDDFIKYAEFDHPYIPEAYYCKGLCFMQMNSKQRKKKSNWSLIKFWEKGIESELK